MNTVIYIVNIFIICFIWTPLKAQKLDSLFQIDSLSIDPDNQVGNLRTKNADFLLDTLPPSVDSLNIGNNQGGGSDILSKIPIGESAFEATLMHGALDSQWIDLEENVLYLKGEAYLKYEGTELYADFIRFDFDKNEATASNDEHLRSSGRFVGEGQNLEFKKMKFNFDTEKGYVEDVVTRQAEYYIYGAKTKFISKNKDSLYVDDVVFNRNALVTTCNHPQPHYGIRASKLKLIPEKLGVMGPANLEFAGIPTPLYVPFAFLPVIQGQRSGLIFGGTEGIEFSATRGVGLREIGYYWYINDYVDLKVVGDIYSRGSWGLRTSTNYAKRYKYRGNFSLGYSSLRQLTSGELIPSGTKSFSMKLNHNQDTKAHPYLKIGGNFSFQTNNYASINQNDVTSNTQNTYNSNFNISHSLPSIKPLRLNLNFSHAQNTATGNIDFTLPNAQLQMSTVNPFKRNRGGNKAKWYENISVNGGSSLKNFVRTQDSILFTSQTLDKLQTGMSNDVTLSGNFKLLEHINFSQNISYENIVLLKTLEKVLNDTLDVDSTYTGSTSAIFEDELRNGLEFYQNARFSMNLNTAIFGTMLFKKGKLRGLRHTMTPNIGISFVPGTTQYLEVAEAELGGESFEVEYNPFSGGVFSPPSFTDTQLNLNYSITNIFEAKLYNRKKDETKNIKLFDNIFIGGSYNFKAEQYNWSRVSMRANARIIKNISTLSLTASFDPYSIDESFSRQPITQWSANPEASFFTKLLRFENFQARWVNSLRFGDIRKLFSKNKKEIDDELKRDSENSDELEDEFNPDRFNDDPLNPDKEQYQFGEKPLREDNEDDTEDDRLRLPSFWEALDQFSISHTFNMRLESIKGRTQYQTQTHTINLRGSIPLTDKWAIRLGNISYDFKSKSLRYPSVGVSRDLHCWIMNFDWQPERRTFQFNIAVKTGQLASFLKYNYNIDRFDAIF